MLKDIQPHQAGYVIDQLLVASGTLFFDAWTKNGEDFVLWKSDGSAAGTAIVGGYALTIAELGNLANMGGKLYFTAHDVTHGNELWVVGGSASSTLNWALYTQ